MKKLSWLVIISMLPVLISTFCVHAVQGSTVPKAAWQEKWDKIVVEAKKEGKIVIYISGWNPETRGVLSSVFKEKYGINLEFSPFSRGEDMVVKVDGEKRAGLNLVDIFGAGGGPIVVILKPRGLVGPIEPLLVLPEVTDPKFWIGGKFPFLDKDKSGIAMIAGLERDIAYNTNLIKEGEITSYKDLLKPQYKEKITLNDPSVSGVGSAAMTFLAHDIWNIEDASEFLKQLIKQQKVVIQRDNRLHVESVARGKFAIGLAPNPQSAADFLKINAPIGLSITKEGVRATPKAGCMAVPTNPAHPNATAVFVNWLLSKEGQTIFSKAFGSVSTRSDVSTQGILPILLPQPGEKVYSWNEEHIILQGRMHTIAKKIIEEADK